MGKNKNTSVFNMSNVIEFMTKHARILITVTVVAFLASVIVALILKPKYKSTTIIFPASPATVAKTIMSPNYVTSRGADIYNFGNEDECDQMMQILLSRELKDSMNARYNLMEHYGINPTSRYARTKFYEAYDDNFRFRRTSYNSIVIQVTDVDPELAAVMAKDLVILADSFYRRIIRERMLIVYNVIKQEFDHIDSLIKVKENRMKELAQKGIFDYDLQGKELTRAYYKALSTGKTHVTNEIKRKFEIVQKYGTEYNNLDDDLKTLYQQRNEVYLYKLKEAHAALITNMSNKYIIERPIPADKKSWPIRSVIVLTSTIAAFLLTLFGLAFVESIKKYF